MAPRLILTTRPAEDAAKDIEFIERSGGRAIGAPMLEITPIDADLPDASSFNAVVLTSRHAVEAARAGGFHRTDCYCVGEATAMEAEEAGFGRVIQGPGNGGGLAGMIAAKKPGRVFWASALDTGFDMQKALEAMGVEVVRLAVYKAGKARDLPADALAVLRKGVVGAALVHSGRAGEHFSDLLARHGLEDQRAAMALVAISRRAAGLCGDGWRTIEIVDSPLRADMLGAALDAVGEGDGRTSRRS